MKHEKKILLKSQLRCNFAKPDKKLKCTEKLMICKASVLQCVVKTLAEVEANPFIVFIVSERKLLQLADSQLPFHSLMYIETNL